MIDSLIGWKRSSVVHITGPLPSAGGRVVGGQWLTASGCGVAGAA
jgi:hypothetical protein